MVKGKSFKSSRCTNIVEIKDFGDLDTSKHQHFGLAELCPLDGCDGSTHQHIDDGEGGVKIVPLS